jgi:hypothetical protein
MALLSLCSIALLRGQCGLNPSVTLQTPELVAKFSALSSTEAAWEIYWLLLTEVASKAVYRSQKYHFVPY